MLRPTSFRLVCKSILLVFILGVAAGRPAPILSQPADGPIHQALGMAWPSPSWEVASITQAGPPAEMIAFLPGRRSPQFTGHGSAGPDMVLKWNQILLQMVRTERTPPPMAVRNMAIVHAAVYDAVNGILQTHQVYKVPVTAKPGTSPEAAAAAAAYAALVNLYPKQKQTLDAEFARSWNQIPAGPGRDQGVEVGYMVASQMLTWRSQDRATNPGNYQPRNAMGYWVPTPPQFLPALLPGWGSVMPFAMRPGTAPSIPGPPPLASSAFAQAFQEVQALGGKDSKVRTADQTEIAHFWEDGNGTATPPGHWNQIAQTVALARGNSLAENARLFALLNISMADAGIFCWWCKYHYDFWRPVTAIAQAASDDNPQTNPEPNWTPLLVTPPFPSYTSGHSSFSGAAATVLANSFGGDRMFFTATSEKLPGVTRSFPSFWTAAEEAGRSRIYGGIHWQFDNADGLASGRGVANYITQHYLLPVSNPPR